MMKRDTMLMAIEKKINKLKLQGIDTDQQEKRLFALRNRFHTMFHSLDIKLIILESDHILAELEKANGAGGRSTAPLTGAVAIGWALLAALLFYLIKKNVD
jgi:biotin operon repressor